MNEDANVLSPDFCLDQTRSERATHVAGAALDLIFVSYFRKLHRPPAISPLCCPATGSDHFLRVLSALSLLFHCKISISPPRIAIRTGPVRTKRTQVIDYEISRRITSQFRKPHRPNFSESYTKNLLGRSPERPTHIRSRTPSNVEIMSLRPWQYHVSERAVEHMLSIFWARDREKKKRRKNDRMTKNWKKNSALFPMDCTWHKFLF